MGEKLCVFCGSNPGRNKAFQNTAYALGKLIAEEKIELIYGGGRSGLMGIVADSVLESGGRVTGIIPEMLKDLELCHEGVTNLIISKNMHERKRTMYELADYFFILPGGIGTIDEFAEVLTWSQLCIHNKACALINAGGFFDGFLSFLDKTVEEGFLKKEHLGLLIVETSLKAALNKCRSFIHPNSFGKWIDGVKGNSRAG